MERVPWNHRRNTVGLNRLRAVTRNFKIRLVKISGNSFDISFSIILQGRDKN